MPCQGPSESECRYEEKLRQAARLLVYLRKKMGLEVEKSLAEAADNSWTSMTDYTPALCFLLKSLSPAEREALIYRDLRNRTTRELADWWEDHQEADLAREEQERREAKREKLAAQARAKLSKSELKALLAYEEGEE